LRSTISVPGIPRSRTSRSCARRSCRRTRSRGRDHARPEVPSPGPKAGAANHRRLSSCWKEGENASVLATPLIGSAEQQISLGEGAWPLYVGVFVVVSMEQCHQFDELGVDTTLRARWAAVMR